jgi:hypothetical protein
LSTTWADVVGDALSKVRREPQLDEPLPVAYHRDPAALGKAIADRLEEAHRLIDKLDPEALATDTVRRFLTTRPAHLRGQLVDLVSLERLSQDSLLGRRPGSICETVTLGDRLLVMLGDRELAMPGWLAPALAFIAAAERFRPADLATHIADPGSRLVLARRLVREGLLEVLE